ASLRLYDQRLTRVQRDREPLRVKPVGVCPESVCSQLIAFILGAVKFMGPSASDVTLDEAPIHRAEGARGHRRARARQPPEPYERAALRDREREREHERHDPYRPEYRRERLQLALL